MKKKISFLTIVMILFCSSVFAQAQTQDQYFLINKNEQKEKITFGAGKTAINEGTVNNDLFLVGEASKNNGGVTGDIFSLGKSVDIAGDVKGTAFVAGNMINVKEVIGRNAFIAGRNIKVEKTSKIGGSLFVIGEVVEINGIINQDLHISGDDIIINAQILGDADIDGKNITINPNTKIKGNLKYTSDSEVNMPNGVVQGKVQKNVEQKSDKEKTSVVSQFINKVIWTIGLFLMGSIFVYVFKNFFEVSGLSIKKSWLKYLGVGFVGVVFAPIAIILLLITQVGVPVSLMLIFAYSLLLFISSIPVAILLGEITIKHKNKYLKLFVGYLILLILSLIPFIGGISFIATIFIGFGCVLTELLSRKEQV